MALHGGPPTDELAATWRPVEWQLYLDSLPSDMTAEDLAVLDRRFQLTQSRNYDILEKWLPRGVGGQRPLECGPKPSDWHLDCPGLHVTDLSIDTDAITVACPDCGRDSDQVHSRYTRLLGDLPVRGRRLVLRVPARRFYCRRPDCHRRVFCERLPGVAAVHARTTGR